MPTALDALHLDVRADLPRPPSSATTVGFRSERGPILVAIMTTTALVAIDSTILAAAVIAAPHGPANIAPTRPAVPPIMESA